MEYVVWWFFERLQGAALPVRPLYAVVAVTVGAFLFFTPVGVHVNAAEAAENGGILARVVCRVFSVWCPNEQSSSFSGNAITGTISSAIDPTANARLGEATTTIVYQTIEQPVIERVVERVVFSVSGGITEALLNARLKELENTLSSRMLSLAGTNFSGTYAAYTAAGALGRIESLDDLLLTNATVKGVTGLTDADIPDTITASNYLPLSGGSLAFASSTLLSAFNGAYFGATATSSFDGLGNLSLVHNGISVGTNQFIVANGNIGIGTTTPWAKLSVGQFNGGTSPLFVIASSTGTGATSTEFILDASGHVGIGTGIPQTLVHIRQMNIGVTSAMMADNHGYLVVEDEDARLGLFSRNEGGHGSTISLAEVNSGVYQDQWAIGRDSSGFGSALNITYGTNSDYTLNPTFLKLGATDSFLNMGTTDGSDNKRFRLAGGGGLAVSRGAYINLMGNEYSGQEGDLALLAGNSGVTNRGAIRFYTGNGLERMTIDSSGRVGIGTTTPLSTSRFHLQTTSTGADHDTVATAIFESPEGHLQLVSDNSGSHAAALVLTSLHSSWVMESRPTAQSNRFSIGRYTSAGDSDIVANYSEYLSISAGRVGIATTSPWRTLSVTGTVGFDGLTGSTGAGSLCLTANKEIVYNSGSDACLPSLRGTKHDVSSLSLDALEIVGKLNPVSFVYNEGDGHVRYGFIAEDTAAVDSHIVTYSASGTLSGIDDRSILAIIAKAIQELTGKIVAFADSFTTDELRYTRAVGGALTTKELTTDKLCVGTICVTSEQFLRIVEESGQSSATESEVFGELKHIINDEEQLTDPTDSTEEIEKPNRPFVEEISESPSVAPLIEAPSEKPDSEAAEQSRQPEVPIVS